MLCHGAPASISTTALPLCSRSATAPRPAASCSVASPGQQQLSHHGASASNSFATAPRPATSLSPRRLGQQHLIWRSGQQIHHCAPCQRLLQGASASNKPHLAEKSPPVWLAIWHIWAGFANSQLLPDAAALYSIHGLPRSGNSSAQTSASLHPPAALRLRVLPFTRGMVAHGLCGRVPDSAVNLSPWIASAQTDANLSAHLHRLPTPPPYLRRMRLSPGQDAGVRCRRLLPFGWGCGCRVLDDAVSSQGRRCWVANDAAGCPWHSSCKSPRARILVLGTSGAHWPARWPQFVLTEHGPKSYLSGYKGFTLSKSAR